MIRFRTAALVLALIAVLVPGVQAAWADDDDRGGSFSVRDVQGPNAFAFDGFVAVGGTFVPAAAVGRFVSDGRGRLTNGVRTLSVGGVPSHQTFECTYTVNPDGTGHADCIVVGGPLPQESFDFVIVERKKRAFFTSVTPGVTIRGETHRQH